MTAKKMRLFIEVPLFIVGIPSGCYVFQDLIAIELLRWPMFIVSIIIYLFAILSLLYYTFDVKALKRDVEIDVEKGEGGYYYILGIPGIFCLSFLCVCYSTSFVYPDSFVNTPQYENLGYSSDVKWFLYLLDNIFRVVLLDTLETFYISITQIRHSHNMFVCILVFSFRTVLSIALIKYVVSSSRFVVKKLVS